MTSEALGVPTRRDKSAEIGSPADLRLAHFVEVEKIDTKHKSKPADQAALKRQIKESRSTGEILVSPLQMSATARRLAIRRSFHPSNRGVWAHEIGQSWGHYVSVGS
jgi:hypothetical protein